MGFENVFKGTKTPEESSIDITQEEFDNIYNENSESAFSDGARYICSLLAKHGFAEKLIKIGGDEEYPKEYVDTLHSMRRYLKEDKGIKCKDVAELEGFVVSLFTEEELSNDPTLALYVSVVKAGSNESLWGVK